MGWASKAVLVWQALTREAATDAQNQDATLALAQRSEHKAINLKSQLGEIYDDLRAVLRLLRHYAKGNYRAISKASLLSILGAIAYFLLPLDAIPDWILGAGLIDDVLIMSRVFTLVRKDIQAFRDWEEASSTASVEQES